MKIAARVLLVIATLVASVDGSGCHGASGFRLAPAHATKRSSSSSSKSLANNKQVPKDSKPASNTPLTLQDKNAMCEEEYGTGSQLLDLEQLEGEFKSNPSDLQHALTPLFEENPDAIYYVADHGRDREDLNQFILRMETGTPPQLVTTFTRVAGDVFLEALFDDGAQEEELLEDADVLCHIPKPVYKVDSSMNMKNMPSMEKSSSASSWTTTLLSLVAVAAVVVAAVQTYQSRKASSNTMSGPSLDLGGSYSVLAGDNDLAQELAPSSTTELV